jgi:hypothetical protein
MPRHSVSPPLRSARARLTESIDEGVRRDLRLRCEQYWTHVHTRIWADHANSCERELALVEAHIEQQRREGSQGAPMAATNAQMAGSGLPSLRLEWLRAREALGRLIQHQAWLPNARFQNQQVLYQQLVDRNGIDEQLQSPERGGNPPCSGS